MSVRIVAEAAQGYEGKLDYCHLYVKAAAKAGADAVKFQVVYADDICEPGHVHYGIFTSLEMSVEQWQEVKDHADKLGITFVADIFGERSLRIVEKIRPQGIKIHTTDFFNRDLVKASFAIADRVFVSTGGAAAGEIDEIVEQIDGWGGRKRLVLLCGFQAEPTPIDRSGLSKIQVLRARFPDIEIGYLDHTAGDSPDRIQVSAMAMALGAAWIEKHITLSRYLEIEDYISALEPDEFAEYVAAMQRLGTAIGRPDLDLTDEERVYRDKAMKKVLAARPLKAGSKVRAEDLRLIRSPRIPAGAGVHDPRLCIGRRLAKDVAAEAPILMDCLE